MCDSVVQLERHVICMSVQQIEAYGPCADCVTVSSSAGQGPAMLHFNQNSEKYGVYITSLL